MGDTILQISKILLIFPSPFVSVAFRLDDFYSFIFKFIVSFFYYLASTIRQLIYLESNCRQSLPQCGAANVSAKIIYVYFKFFLFSLGSLGFFPLSE